MPPDASVIRVLFVDDEPLVLRALGRMTNALRAECEASFCESGEQALQLLSEARFDAVVTDMRMPGMDGATMLSHAERKSPATARIILSGYTHYEAALRALPVSHRFLSKPLGPDDLRSVLMRTIALHRMLGDETLRELVGGAKDLPARPQVYFQLRSALANPTCGMPRIARIVERDQGVTGRLLRAVNNAFFAPARRITSAQQAIAHLGTELVTGLVLSLECFGNFDSALASCSISPETLERKAFLAAAISRELLSDETEREDAFLASLLHDCGFLLLSAQKPALAAQAVRLAATTGCALPAAERQLLGATHAEIGAYLLGLWGLPYSVVDAVAGAYAPERHTGRELDVGAAVYLAAALADAVMRGELHTAKIDQTFLDRKDLTQRWPDILARVERIAGAGPEPEPITDAHS